MHIPLLPENCKCKSQVSLLSHKKKERQTTVLTWKKLINVQFAELNRDVTVSFNLLQQANSL